MRRIFNLVIGLILIPQLCFAGVDFDGVDDQVDFSDVTLMDGATQLSISFWLYIQTLSTNRIMTKWGNLVAEESFIISCYTAGNDEILFGVGDCVLKRYIRYTNAANLVINTWYHVVCVWSGGQNITIYINGSSLATTVLVAETVLNIGNSPSNLQFGYENDESFAPVNMILDEVAIYTSILTQTEILNLYNSRIKGMPLQIQPTNLKGYWPMDDMAHGENANGKTVMDMSGNNNHGTADDGANNTGCTWVGEQVLSYPTQIY